jgi:hypothetical protein
MRNFDVYFELYGKKMKARVMAENENDAKKEVEKKIIFHKVEKPKEEFNDSMDIFDNILNILK